jgi:hypothetical protein
MRRRSLKESRTRRAVVTSTALVALATAAAAYAGPTPAQQCQSGKNKTAAKYAACRGGAESKLAASGDAVKYGETITKCAAKFAATWPKLEAKAVAAGSACPSADDAMTIANKVDASTGSIAALVGGARFADNGDGTVSDYRTGFQWEKKTNLDDTPNPADPHDADNTYTWSTTIGGTAPNGTIFTDFLDKLNGGLGANTCFASQCDWRLPTFEELRSLLVESYPCDTSPCIDPIFGATLENSYWTFTTVAGAPVSARRVDFYDGYDDSALKDIGKFVRAIRGGS